jgi:hypothetical protein
VKFKELNQPDQASVLRMAQQVSSFRLLFLMGDESTIEPHVEWFLDNVTEHFLTMKKLGGIYGDATLDV